MMLLTVINVNSEHIMKQVQTVDCEAQYNCTAMQVPGPMFADI